MISVNEYFEGKVKSLSFQPVAGKATVGVMAPGEYEFGTGAPEKMTLIRGDWSLQLPGSNEFVPFAEGVTVDVPGDSKFKLRIARDSAYLCEYV